MFGVSDAVWPLYDLDHGRRAIGYHPQDRCELTEQADELQMRLMAQGLFGRRLRYKDLAVGRKSNGRQPCSGDVDG